MTSSPPASSCSRRTAHVLDLGAGTGGLSAAVLGGLPGARVTLVDVDTEMLDEARRRLAPFAERVRFREASFLDPLPAADAMVASLALHHVHDLDAKTDLYRSIHGALVRGVCFSTSTRRSRKARASTR